MTTGEIKTVLRRNERRDEVFQGA
jgi:hypothetical protein